MAKIKLSKNPQGMVILCRDTAAKKLSRLELEVIHFSTETGLSC